DSMSSHTPNDDRSPEQVVGSDMPAPAGNTESRLLASEDSTPVVLLVDDAPEIHRLLGVKLRNDDLTLLSAFSGEEAIEMAADLEPSLILLDLNMPGIDGLETLKRLKDQSETIEIPVIILSGSTTSSDKVVSFGLGATDYVTKPFDVPELRARIASSLRVTRLMRMLAQRAQIDGLTGLWNRAHLNDKLASEIDQSTRTGDPLSLVMCDLDHFKILNDTYGHPAGDLVLQCFARILKAEMRKYDVACRYGGEEFALIVPGTEAAAAAGLCERIRVGIAEARWPRYPEMTVTGSFGIATSGLAGTSEVSDWIEAADRALYSAKEAGRNRVHVFDRTLGKGQPPLRLAG
ncbi:MAG: diguanylate cyclase, partial [Phycisphaerales bacterium]